MLPLGPGDRQAKQAGCRQMSPSSSQGHRQRAVVPHAQVLPMPGASPALGNSALIRGPANGSEDWPVPGTLLNRDLGEIYS